MTDKTRAIMYRMGFSEADTGPMVTELRTLIKRQVSQGLVNRSAGTWAPEHGLAGMKLSPEERARVFLEVEWELEQLHSCEVKCMDPVWGWKYDFKKEKWKFFFRGDRLIPKVGDGWRQFRMDCRVFWNKRVLGRANPYARR